MVTCRTIAVTTAEYAVEKAAVDDNMNIGGISCITTTIDCMYGVVFTGIDVNRSKIGVIAWSIRRLVTTAINCVNGKF